MGVCTYGSGKGRCMITYLWFHTDVSGPGTSALLWQGVTWSWYFKHCKGRRKGSCLGARLITSGGFYSPVPLQRVHCRLWADCGAHAELRNCGEHPTRGAKVTTPKVAVARCWLPPSNLNFGNSFGRLALPWQPWWGYRGLPGWTERLSCFLSLKSVGKVLQTLVLQQQQKVIVGLDLGGRKPNLRFNVHMLSPPRQQSLRRTSQGDYCASGKNNPWQAAVPAVAACLGSTGMCVDAVAPGWKHCEGEQNAGGKLSQEKL